MEKDEQTFRLETNQAYLEIKELITVNIFSTNLDIYVCSLMCLSRLGLFVFELLCYLPAGILGRRSDFIFCSLYLLLH